MPHYGQVVPKFTTIKNYYLFPLEKNAMVFQKFYGTYAPG